MGTAMPEARLEIQPCRLFYHCRASASSAQSTKEPRPILSRGSFSHMSGNPDHESMMSSGESPSSFAMAANASGLPFLFPVSICDRYGTLRPLDSANCFRLIPRCSRQTRTSFFITESAKFNWYAIIHEIVLASKRTLTRFSIKEACPNPSVNAIMLAPRTLRSNQHGKASQQGMGRKRCQNG